MVSPVFLLRYTKAILTSVNSSLKQTDLTYGTVR